jgi:1-acyl-sn-glycerol-3-phosphate acyltransferase
VAVALAFFVAVAPLHLLTKLVLGRSPWPRRFLAGVSRIFGARARVEGGGLGPHTLLVSNHLSWFDIVVLGGATGCTFVAKDELGHPFIHWLADQNHTVYVKRTQRGAAKDQAIEVARSLERDQPVTMFAEGTTGPGTHLLPFRSALFEAANYASKEVTIRPLALDYGGVATDVSWWEQPAMENVWSLLGRRGTIPVTVRLLDPLNRLLDRKQLAAQAREQIAAALGFKSDAQSPIGGSE